MADSPLDSTFLTVPTASAHPELLIDLVENCGLPPQRIIVVATRAGVEVPPGVVVIPCLHRFNIQHWWNLGIAEAVRRGGRYVFVSNDDVRVASVTLSDLLRAMTQYKAALACPGPSEVHVTAALPFSRALDGSFWLLDASTGLRPDERFVWWYGDDDLDLRSRRRHGGLAMVPTQYEHLHGNKATEASPELAEQIRRDGRAFRRKHAALLASSQLLRGAIRIKARLTRA